MPKNVILEQYANNYNLANCVNSHRTLRRAGLS